MTYDQFEYAFVDASQRRKVIAGTQLNYSGTWSSTGTYVYKDAVSRSGDNYIALDTSVNADPLNGTHWSYLVNLSGTSTTGETVDVTARSMAAAAQADATAALSVAQSGSFSTTLYVNGVRVPTINAFTSYYTKAQIDAMLSEFAAVPIRDRVTHNLCYLVIDDGQPNVIITVAGTAPYLIGQSPSSGTSTFDYTSPDAVLNASFGGYPDPDLQWYKDSSVVVGATGTSLALTGFSSADIGAYYCLATNQDGTATSGVVNMRVNDYNEMASQVPVAGSYQIVEGIETTLSVTVDAYPSPTYQWYKNAAVLPGETNNAYVIAAFGTENEGVYQCLITAGSAITYSDGVTLTLLPPV